jgi:hypothetical protein
MRTEFDEKAATGGLSGKDLFLANSNLDKAGSNNLIDAQIDKNDKSVDANLAAMTDHFG